MRVESILGKLVDKANAKNIIAIVEEEDGISSYTHGYSRDIVSAIVFQMQQEQDIASMFVVAVNVYLKMQGVAHE